MDLRASITAAMDEIMNRAQVTLDGGSQPRIPDLSILSSEERDFYKLMFGDDIAAVRHRRLHCTACDVHIGSAPAKSSNMFAHPILRTLLCAECRKFYGDGNFEQGEDATDMFCRWCANGGNLYCCSYCSNTFCNKCIKRNFDPVIRKKIEDEEKWKCFVCDPTDLYTARAVCWALLQHVQTVTRILRSDVIISNDCFKQKMNLDESKCCSKKRSKTKRRKTGITESDAEDETYQPTVEGRITLRATVSKRSPRLSSITNGQQDESLRLKIEAESFNEEDDDEELPPPMIPCVQFMVEGDSSETLNETLNSQRTSPNINQPVGPSQPTPQINPIPTANLLKAAPPPPMLTPMRSNPLKRKRSKTLQPILPAPSGKGFLISKNPVQNIPPANVHGVEYSSRPLRPPSRINTPMVAIPSNTSPPRIHTIEYSSLPSRAPSTGYKQSLTRISIHKPIPSSSAKEVGVIEIDSDSDEPEVEERITIEKDSAALRRSRNILKNMLNKTTSDGSPKFPELFAQRRFDKASNKVEEEIDLRTEEVRMLFKMIGTKLRKVPTLHLPNHNSLRSTRVKTRRFHLALTKAISALSEINDKVVHKYGTWRQSMLEESKQTRSEDLNNRERKNEVDIPLDMTCTNSESDSDENEDYDSDEMTLENKVKIVKSFQERDTIDIGVGEPLSTADKAVQAFDVVDRDYEQCIGHSVLTKVEYDPVDGLEILKPVIVPAEYNGKFEEQFIFYLQHREENEVQTDDDKGLPDPNETPLKDLIEANSPFVLEMLESIDSPMANGRMVGEPGGAENSDESGKENKDQGESTNVVKELAKMVTELSEDLKTSKNNETLTKKYSEHGKKDRRKQILESIESEEVDIAVQTLIEEDERSGSSSNEEMPPRNGGQIRTEQSEKAAIEYTEDDCTIID